MLLIVGIGSPHASLLSVWVILEDQATDGTPCTAGPDGAVVVVARRRLVGTTGRPLQGGPVACVVLVLVAGVAVGVDSATRPVGPLGPKIRDCSSWCSSSSWLRVLAARGRVVVVVVVGAVATTTGRTTTTITNSKHSHRRSGSGFSVPGTVVSASLERRWHSSSSSRQHHEDVLVRYCCCSC